MRQGCFFLLINNKTTVLISLFFHLDAAFKLMKLQKQKKIHVQHVGVAPFKRNNNKKNKKKHLISIYSLFFSFARSFVFFYSRSSSHRQ